MEQKKLKKLLEKEAWVYEFLAEEYKEQKELACIAVNNGDVYECLPKHLKRDKEVLLAAIEYGGDILDEMDEELFRDMDIARKIVEVFPYDYEYLPEDMQKDRTVALECVQVRGDVYGMLCRELQEDEEIMEAAIRHGVDLIELAGRSYIVPPVNGSEKLLKREDLIRIAIEQLDGNQMCYAAAELWDKKELVEFALEKGFSELKYLPENLRSDRKLVVQVVENISPEADDALFQMIHIAEELRQKEEFWLELIEKKEKIFQYILNCKKDPVLAKYVPIETGEEFCKKAYQINKKTLKYMNKEMKAAVKQ